MTRDSDIRCETNQVKYSRRTTVLHWTLIGEEFLQNIVKCMLIIIDVLNGKRCQKLRTRSVYIIE